MNKQLQTLMDFIQQNETISAEEKSMLLKEIKKVSSDLEITEFKLERTEKVKRTTAILLEETIEELEQKRKAVEAQNRDLEIESSLERVRTVAMSMCKPDDMLEVCRIISRQSESLGIKDIRNVQTAIIYDEKGTYLNYEYYAKHEKLFVTEVDYKNHELQSLFANQMLRGAEELFATSLTGNEVKDWYDYQKTTNQFADSYLENAQSLNYYFYSLGPVALGLSTYAPLSEEEISLFKRFRNVLDLAYRRFLDIEQAESQAREAKIEASLERVRAQALSMRKPDDLPGICEVLFTELHTLGFAEIRNAMINIHDDEKASFVNYDYSDVIGQSINHLTYDIHPLIEKQVKQIRSAEDAFSVTSFAKEDLKDWIEFRKKIGEKDDPRIENTDALFYYFYSIGTGSVGISTFSSITDEKLNVLKRFRNVFDFAYRRYTDVAQAEAQAREAQIELGLERVRARAMAMQNSSELADLVATLFKELIRLDFALTRCYIYIIDPDSLSLRAWTFNTEIDELPESYYIKYLDLPYYKALIKAWKERKQKFVYELGGEEKKVTDMLLLNETEYRRLPEPVKSGMMSVDRVFLSYSFNNFGGLQIGGLEPLSDENLDIFSRFGKVFDLTYTRFNDLKLAEAQAREAQIELGLERVRARAMAMQNSNELADLVATLFKELTRLDFALSRCYIYIIDPDSLSLRAWTFNKEIDELPESYYIKYLDLPYYKAMINAWKERNPSFVYELGGEEKKAAEQVLFNETVYIRLPEAVKKGMMAAERAFLSFSFNNFGGLQTGGLEPLSDENLDIFSRFGKVFDLTYTRFNDLKQAEAQALEAQIQLALERVRARTMAMQKSEELSEAVFVLFQQFSDLGENPDQATIGIINEEEHLIEYWVTMYGNQVNKVFKFSIDEPHVTGKIYKAWKEHKKSMVIDLSGKALSEFMAYRAAMGGATINPNEKRRIINVAFFSKGLLNVQSNVSRSLESIQLLERFAKVFEQTYTRFLDLQKAEAQARESQIQLALERVRARAMAMQRSDEMAETAAILFEQFIALGEIPERMAIEIVNEAEHVFEIWATEHGGKQFNSLIKTSLDEPYVMQKMYRAWKERNKSITIDLQGNELEAYFQYLKKLKLPVDRKIFGKRRVQNVATFSRGILTIITPEPRPRETIEILERFAAVFDGTYTRFLDLQKAEAQAREAQIEAALERVRSRTMGMQRSDELQDSALLLFQQIQGLGLPPFACGFNIWDEDWKSATAWIGSVGGLLPPFKTDSSRDIYLPIYEAAKRGESIFVREQSGKELEVHYDYLATIPIFRDIILEDWKRAGISIPTFQIIHCAYFTQGYLMFISFEPVPTYYLIFKRFAKVFEQTYTRFLDLKKAEAQANDAQIEAALERVRAKSMAMHNSRDVGNTVAAMFDELIKLGAENLRCGILIIDPSKHMEVWTASSDENGKVNLLIGSIDMMIHPLLQGAHYAWENKESTFTYELEGQDLIEYYKAIIASPDYPFKISIESLPAKQINTEFFFPEGALFAFTTEPLSADLTQIFKKFAGVFGLTYRRFLDLQKAEANARESQIEAGLERVRSRTLAMQKSDELVETAAVVFRQLIALGIAPNRLYIAIIKDKSGNIEFWITDEDGNKVSTQFTGNSNRNRSIQKMYDGWKSHKKSVKIDMQGKELADYIHYLGDEIKVPFKKGPSQKRRVQTLAYFSKGFIGLASPDEQPVETTRLLERFAGVFNLTFTRFNDLKLAEAQVHQAHLDLIQLQTEKKRAEEALAELKSTQTQLIQSEKMASLGELTAGIAHEIQNPLNFVNNFSEVSNELLDEMNTELDNGDIQEAKAIASDVKLNLEKILHHGKRADAIVKGMLQHSRSSSGVKEPTNINALADEYLRLAYHGLRAKDKSFNATLNTDFDESIGKIDIIPQEIGRVILNLITNAFYAVDEKKKSLILQGFENYEPTVSVNTSRSLSSGKGSGEVLISVKDNGNGIPQNIVDKIFQPFFTTKPTGSGTGLGLSLSYDIVKAHGGKFNIHTVEGEGSEFIIQLPN